MQKQKVLTISILISKRPDTVRKCLDSIKPILEELDTELILTDTGCGEEVRSIIEEYTDNIIDFVWCKDFSKARNVGLKAAKGEWFLFLDDDEWFEDVSDIIHFFKSGEYKAYGIATYYQRNYLDEAGKDYEDLLVGRTIKLEKDIHFQYAIHECFNRVPGKTKVLNAYVHHYGYVYKTAADRMAHSERNVSLLLVEHEKDPYNLKHIIQLIQEYNSLEQRDKSLALSLEGIGYSGQGKATQEFCRNSLFANVINCYMYQKEYRKIIEEGNKYLEAENLDDLAKAAIYFRLAPAYFIEGYPDKALDAAKEYWKRFEYQQANPEDYLPYVTNITASAFRIGYLNILLCVAVRACLALKDYKQAKQWLKRLQPDSDHLKILEDVAKDIIDLLPEVEGEDYRLVVSMADFLLNREEEDLNNYLIGCIEEKCYQAGENKDKVLLLYAELASDGPFFQIIRILKGLQEKDRVSRISEQLQQLCGRDFSLCFRSMLVYGLWDKALLAGIDVAGIIQNIPCSIWDKVMLDYCAKGIKDERESFHQWISQLLDQSQLHLLSWNKAYYSSVIKEKALDLRVPDNNKRTEKNSNEVLPGQEEWNELKENIEKFTAAALAFFSNIFQSWIFEQDPGMLPSEGVAACYLNRTLKQLEAGKYTQAVDVLKELKYYAPDWAVVIQLCMKGIQTELEEQDKVSNDTASEMLFLGEQLKKKAAEYLNQGEKQTARMILMQLKGILPQDKEIDHMLNSL